MHRKGSNEWCKIFTSLLWMIFLSSFQCFKWAHFTFNVRNTEMHPGCYGSVDWVPACEPKGWLIGFTVRAQAWVAGQVPSRGRTRGNHTLMFLSLSPSLPLSLKISKNLKIKIKIKKNPEAEDRASHTLSKGARVQRGECTVGVSEAGVRGEGGMGSPGMSWPVSPRPRAHRHMSWFFPASVALFSWVFLF